MPKLRLIHDSPASGAWNMAIDEVMLESVAASGQPILRFYAWSEPTLSLGYFQASDDRRLHAASLACPLVRRSTGGGAIVHDRELTYSIAVPLTNRWSSAAKQLYAALHGSLIATLEQFGIAASLCQSTLYPLGNEPFLCFERRAKGDVVLGPHKIAGSAQRRRREAMLQHGSLLLAASPAAPELPGLAELSPRVLPGVHQFAEYWLENVLTNRLSIEEAEKSAWTAAEVVRAAEIERTRFAASDWTHRRATASPAPPL